MKHCKKCNKEISDEEYDSHMNYCDYVPKEAEFNTLIPCEICNNYIEFSEYDSHSSTCSNQSYYTQLFNNISQSINTLESYNPSNYTNNIQPSSQIENLNNEPLDNQNSNEQNEINSENNDQQDNEQNNNQEYLDELINNMHTIMNTLINNPNIVVNHTPHDEYEELNNLGSQIGSVTKNLDIDEYTKEYNICNKCPICFEDKINNRITNCQHILCEECMGKWLKTYNKCPICMIELKKINEI
jgi:hypothetical protein